MDNQAQKRVDVARIMAEIKQEIRDKGLHDELPAFDQIPVVSYRQSYSLDLTGLREKIQATRANCVIQALYPVEGNALKRLFKKVSQRATRCSIGPMALRLTESNMTMIDCMEHAASVINDQQNQLREMDEKIKALTDALNQGVVRK